MFKVFRSMWYDKQLSKLDNSEKQRIIKFEEQLKKEPFSGKPLGYNFLREKKFNGKRLIFLVYEEYKTLFLVAISDKKAQKQDINSIKMNLDKYKEEVEKLLKFF